MIVTCRDGILFSLNAFSLGFKIRHVSHAIQQHFARICRSSHGSDVCYECM